MKKLYALTAILGGMLFGYDTAVINGAMPFFTAYFDLSSAELGWVISSGLMGCIIGAMTASFPAERFGRRITMLLSSFLFFCSALGTGLATTVDVFVLARIIGGIAVGLVSVTLPIYLSEVSIKEERGSLTINFQLGIVVGILVAFFVDYILLGTGVNNWRYMFLSMGLPSLLFAICLKYLHRSPRWLVKKKALEEARWVLEKIYPSNQVDAVLDNIQETLSQEDSGVFRLAILKKPYAKFIGIGIAVGAFSQFTGIAIVMYYATDIFRSAGFSTNSSLGQTVILGVTNLLFTLLAKHMIDRLGRKKLLLRGICMMAIFLAIFSSSYFGWIHSSWVMLLALVGFVASFAASMGAVSWVILSEIFPNKIRAVGMSIGSLANWTVNATISFLFPIVASIEPYGTGWCFAFLALMTGGSYFFFRKYLFETRNKSLEEIEKENL